MSSPEEKRLEDKIVGLRLRLKMVLHKDILDVKESVENGIDFLNTVHEPTQVVGSVTYSPIDGVHIIMEDTGIE